jgi:hypothetical protein
MLVVPLWLSLLVAAVVITFGLYRIRLALRSAEEDEKARSKKGLYALPRRTHFLFGILYLLLGAFVIATGFGFRPFR